MAARRSSAKRPKQTRKPSGARRDLPAAPSFPALEPVLAPDGSNPKWTVMVYMAAVRDDDVTEQAAIRDLREMERVGSTRDVHVVVQLDRNWPGTPEGYFIKKGVSTRLDMPPGKPTPTTRQRRTGTDLRSSGDREALAAFLNWALTNHRADHYLLVLWGHAFGLGFGRDHVDPLTLKEIRSALEAFGGSSRLDLLGANACAMSYAEAAFELQNSAKFLVAPEITMPFGGWPYAAILQRMNDELGKGDLAPEDLGELVIDEFMRSFRRTGVALTLLDLGKASFLEAELKKLADALKPALKAPNLSELMADAFLDSAHGDVRPLVDLRDLCSRLAATGHAPLGKVAESFHKKLKPGAGGLILKHDADPDFEGLNGLGIFATAVTSASDLVRLEIDRTTYEELELIENTGKTWSEIVYDDLGDVLEPMNAEVEEYVVAAGASSRDDRAGVGQLLLSAKRSFDKLEQAVRNAKDRLLPLSTSTLTSGRLGHATNQPSFLRLLNGQPNTQGRQKMRTVPPIINRGSIVDALGEIEVALTSTERTLRRVMTNGSLGLGVDSEIKPGFGPGTPSTKSGFGAGSGPVKPGLGEIKPGFGEIKPGLGEIKPGFGEIKPGLGDVDGEIKPGLGIRMTGDGAVLTGDMVAVVDLIRAVASSLNSIEESLAQLEQNVLGQVPSIGMSAAVVRQQTLERADRAFRDLADRVIVARQTCFWVLRHPLYGLGPGGGGANSESRRHLTVVGGLNTRFLRLL